MASIKVSLLVCCGLISFAAEARQFCFSTAESYYEHLYCEIQAKGKGRDLPAMIDFRRNDERMQALLLKQFAPRIGVQVKMPRQTNSKTSTTRKDTEPSIHAGSDWHSSCRLDKNMIICAGNQYQLATNRANKHLDSEMLQEDNKMALPLYRGQPNNQQAISNYLAISYQKYLLKMNDIGLAGSTLSYGKFAFLFDDLKRKGVSFRRRFEVMYSYLKRDKKTMAVPIRPTIKEGLTLADCYPLDKVLVCQQDRTNLVFIEPSYQTL